MKSMFSVDESDLGRGLRDEEEENERVESPGFIIIALVIFFIIRAINRMRREEETPAEEPATQECPFCLSTIPLSATRCAYCTSQLATG